MRDRIGERFSRWVGRRYGARFEGKARWAWRVECWLLGGDLGYERGRFMFLGDPPASVCVDGIRCMRPGCVHEPDGTYVSGYRP